MSEDDQKIMHECNVCGNEYQQGPGVYEGHVLGLYGGAACCDNCWKGNWDGWNPSRDVKLVEICEQRGVPVPARNNKGLLPRGGVEDGHSIQGNQPEFDPNAD